jgi:hypothetical protein
MQQRAVPPLIVQWLLEFGHQRHDHHGGVVYYFDRHSRRLLEREAGTVVVSRLSQFLNCYAVSSTRDDGLVTVGHRCRRFNLS